MSPRFALLTVEDAPAAARPMLAASARQFGFVPGPVGAAAHSPPLLTHLLAGFGAFDRTDLTPLEREVVAMTVAFEHGCHYCMAMHTALQAGAPEAQPIVQALRLGQPLPDAKLEALRQLVRALLHDRGRVPEAVMAGFVRAGYDEAIVLDVVLGVGVYVLSTFVNIVADVALDPPFERFAWHRPH